MMTSPDDSTCPITDDAGVVISGEYGLTKREYFAAQAMLGLLAGDDPNDIWKPEILAHMSVQRADALIDALNADDIPD